MSKVSRGKYAENKAKKELEADGWLTESKPRTKWQPQDFWNTFDIIAVKGDKTLLIQVKSNRSDFYQARKKVKNWIKDNEISIPCQVWLFRKRKSFRKEKYNEKRLD